MTFEEETALNFSFDYANRVLLANQIVRLVDIRSSNPRTDFDAIQIAYSHISKDVSALLGVLSGPMTRTVSLGATTYQIPFFAPKATNPLFTSLVAYPFLIRQSPPDSLQSRAIADIIQYFGWTRMAILTSTSEYGLNGLVRLQNIASLKKWTIYSVQRFESSKNISSIDATQLLLNIRTSGVRIIVLHCNAAEGFRVLSQAAALGMTAAGWQWIVTNSIASSDLWLQLNESMAGLQGLLGTTFRPRKTAFFDHVRQDWTDNTGKQNITSSQGTIMDAVFSIAYAARASPSRVVREVTSTHRTWSRWNEGADALLAFTQATGDGIMGPIQYEWQQPKSVSYDVVSFFGTPAGWEQVGEWHQESETNWRLDMTNKGILMMGATETVADFESTLANRTVRAVFAMEAGFISLQEGIAIEQVKNTSEVPVEWLKGYCIDLFLKLQEAIGFNFTLYLAPDGAFGSKNEETGEWNGIVGELIEKNADFGVASLTINRIRRAEIDFTKPYIDLGLQFIIKKKQISEDSFRFLAPLTPTLWSYIGFTLFVVSFVISICNKLSPYDRHGAFVQKVHKQPKNRKSLKQHLVWKKHSLGTMDIASAIWMSVATMLQQGTPVYPLSPSARITATLWFLLALLVISTYTASMSAFLTQKRLSDDVNSLQDLVNSNNMNYGTLQDSAIFSFFAESQVSLYQRIYSNMKTRGTLVRDTQEGIDLVRGGRFAFIHDSMILEYESQKPPCELRLGGKVFAKLGYGFGLQMNSPFRDELSIHIAQLRERGFLANLKKKWLTVPGGCENKEDNSGILGVNNFLGVFYIIYAGVILSFIVLAAEWIIACFVDVLYKSKLAHHPVTWMDAFRWRRSKLWNSFLGDYNLLGCGITSSRKSVYRVNRSKDSVEIQSNDHVANNVPRVNELPTYASGLTQFDDKMQSNEAVYL